MQTMASQAEAWPGGRASAASSSLANNNNNGASVGGSSAVALSNLMDKIRSRANQYKVWPEIMKLTKTALMDKRGLVVNDAGERNQIERCLDTIQKNITITSLQSMVERLETIARQLGLKFIRSTENDVFITSDMFYVEVLLESSAGYVVDVKIAHQADPVSCPEIVQVLRNGDFVEFTKHLEGLIAIYQLNADK